MSCFPAYVTPYQFFHRCADRRLTWSNIVCNIWPTNGCKSQRIWGIGVGDTEVTHFMGGLNFFSAMSDWVAWSNLLATKSCCSLETYFLAWILQFTALYSWKYNWVYSLGNTTFHTAMPFPFCLEKMGNCTGVVSSWEELVASITLPPSTVLLWTQYIMNVIPDNFQGCWSWVILCQIYVCRVV